MKIPQKFKLFNHEIKVILSNTLQKDTDNSYSKHYIKNLSEQLPEGCELQSVSIERKKPSFQPCSATYIFSLRHEYVDEKLKNRINNILASESLVVERSIDRKGRPRSELADSESHTGEIPGRSAAKKIDLRGFLVSIMIEQNCIIVQCRITSAGSIRIQEIMQLLDLETEMFACPIKRTNVQWQDI